MISPRAQRYLLWIAGCALTGWFAMAMGAGGQCSPKARRCTPGHPLPQAQRTRWEQAGAGLGAAVGLMVAVANDGAPWRRRR